MDNETLRRNRREAEEEIAARKSAPSVGCLSNSDFSCDDVDDGMATFEADLGNSAADQLWADSFREVAKCSDSTWKLDRCSVKFRCPPADFDAAEFALEILVKQANEVAAQKWMAARSRVEARARTLSEAWQAIRNLNLPRGMFDADGRLVRDWT